MSRSLSYVPAVTTVSFGVTGYSLPWDQVGYWALEIVTSLPEALDDFIPGLGKISLLSLRGTFSVSQATLTRFYSIHSFLLPLVSLILLILHFSLLRKQGISGPLWPLGSLLIFALFYDWCEERLEIQSLADDILAKFVPPHVNLFYCFGGLMVTAFLFQGGSGFALTSSYQPRVLEAFSSVQSRLVSVIHAWPGINPYVFQSLEIS